MVETSGAFRPTARAENIERMARETFDVLVIGGGITGAGCALDAAARGLSVALVDRSDFASGTSSRSSKMVHGGMRYLAQYDFALTWEAAHEREVLIRRAPHLIRRLRFLFPAFSKREARIAPVGLAFYEALAGFRGAGHHRASAHVIRDLVPSLDPARVKGAWTFSDARTDDARLVFEILRTAHGFGATVANHVRVTGFGRSAGRIAAASVVDAIDGRQFEIRARAFLSATGVWAHDVGALDREDSSPVLRPAKGIHLYVPAARLPLRAACLFPSRARDGRTLFAVPWGPVVLLGTTDTDYDGSIDHPAVTSEDVEYTLGAVNGSLNVDLETADVVSASAGLRPLVAATGGRTADLSRHHSITTSEGGLTTITGGKLTTYRRMAADAVDAICEQLGEKRASTTKGISIGITRAPADILRQTTLAAEELGVDLSLAACLVQTYGDCAPLVLDLVRDDAALARPICEGIATIGAQIVWAARHEMAQTVEDILARRMRMSLADRDGGLSGTAPELIARERGWDRARADREVAAYADELRAERGPVAPLSIARA